jgi:hypothetical protein
MCLTCPDTISQQNRWSACATENCATGHGAGPFSLCPWLFTPSILNFMSVGAWERRKVRSLRGFVRCVGGSLGTTQGPFTTRVRSLRWRVTDDAAFLVRVGILVLVQGVVVGPGVEFGGLDTLLAQEGGYL